MYAFHDNRRKCLDVFTASFHFPRPSPHPPLLQRANVLAKPWISLCQETHLSSHPCQHYRRDFSYDKVEEPLRHECYGEDEASHAIGRALGAQDEGDGTPAEGVEKNLEYSRSGFRFRVSLC